MSIRLKVHGKNAFAEVAKSLTTYRSGKNEFAEGSKILLNTNLKIILLNHQTLKVMNNTAENCDILATSERSI